MAWQEGYVKKLIKFQESLEQVVSYLDERQEMFGASPS